MARKKQTGFTIIELVIVIVILGILAAIALPKYVDLQIDARKAKLNGAAGAMSSAIAMSHAKFLVDGLSPQTSEGVTVTLANGYPNATSLAPAAGLNGTGNADYTVTPAAPKLTVSPSGVATIANCQVVYTEAAAGGAPTLLVTSTNCS